METKSCSYKDEVNLAKKRFEYVKNYLFSKLREGESLGVNFSGESSSFTRLSHSKIRQRTEVEQSHMSLELIKDKRSSEVTFSCSESTSEEDLDSYLCFLQDEVDQLPSDPFCVAHCLGEESSQEHRGELPVIDDVLNFLGATLEGVDLAGQIVSGMSFQANANSLGQNHWFSSESMYLDYSLYSAKEKAVKGSYATTHYSEKDLAQAIEESKSALRVMDQKNTRLKPGKYRVYIAPAALHEITGMLKWHALSGAAYKQGECPLGAAFEGEKTLSPLLNINEDFSLGLAPRFNENGELADESMPIIKEGELVNLLVSKATEIEFGLQSNKASNDEAPRSLVIDTGDLKRSEILKELGTGVFLSNLHYLNWSDKNNGRMTGMTRFGCLWVEDGEVVGPIEDMRFDETLYQVFGDGLSAITNFSEVAMATGSYDERDIGGVKLPGFLVDDFTFTL